MLKKRKISAILLMGGKGERFDTFLPKQFHNLSGKKIYLHTLAAFLKTKLFDQIILVCNKEALDIVKNEISNKIVKIIPGGDTRQQSSYNGLISCDKNTDIVVIHDAVRPFISKRIILENIKGAIKHKAVDTCIDTFDTIVQKDSSNFIKDIPKRSSLLRGQTPQSFNYKLILEAHKKALKDNIFNSSDDCSLALRLGTKIYIVQGDDLNIKITNKLDLYIAEQLFRYQTASLEKNQRSLENKTFVVIGGSGGIGSQIIKLLKKEKAKVISLYRSSDLPLNLIYPSSIRKAFLTIYNRYGKIDGLINAAGFLKVSSLKKLTIKEIEELIDINYKGLILSCKEAKIKNKGHIINISSSSCFKGRKNFSIYSSCKAGVVNFTQALSEEFPNMKINTIIPERTNTAMRRDNFPNENPKSLLSPQKVAKAVIDLLKNNELTGSIIEVKK